MKASAQDRESPWRHHRRTVVGLAAILVLATAGGVWVQRRQAAPEATAARPSSVVPSKAARVAAVTYEVSGKGRMTIQYLDPARTETVTLTDQPLPWRVEFPLHPVSFVQITARRTTGWDTHPVRALVDGVEVCSGTDEGGYMQSTCSELVRPL